MNVIIDITLLYISVSLHLIKDLFPFLDKNYCHDNDITPRSTTELMLTWNLDFVAFVARGCNKRTVAGSMMLLSARWRCSRLQAGRWHQSQPGNCASPLHHHMPSSWLCSATGGRTVATCARSLNVRPACVAGISGCGRVAL